MKHGLALLVLAASSCVFAQPAERPNQPVFRSGPWFVVRSVRDGGKLIACTGFYRANGHVQLSKDTLIIKTPEEAKGVAFGFDDRAPGPQRPLSAGERELKAIAFSGDDFKALTSSKKVRIDVETPQGIMRHELELNGLAAALDNIDKGCPVPDAPKTQPARRRRHG
jgi:hypothetical protein